MEAAWALLEELTRKEARGLAQPLLDSPEKRARLRAALLVRAVQSHFPLPLYLYPVSHCAGRGGN